MKKFPNQLLYSLACAALFVLAPLSALADGASTNNADMSAIRLPRMLITEFQTGSATSGKDEFIELYNTTNAPIDIANWQVRYVSAGSTTATLGSPSQTIMINPPTGNASLFVPAAGYFVLRTSTVAAPANTLTQIYSYTLPATGGSVALFATNNTTCQYMEIDSVAWGGGTFGQGQAINASSKDADYQRYTQTDGQYVESYGNGADFGVATVPTPGNSNTLQMSVASPAIAAPPASSSFANPACTLPIVSPPVTATGDGGNDPNGADSSSGGDGGLGGLQPPTDGDTPPTGSDTGDSGGASGGNSQTGDQSGMPSSDVGLVAPQLTELLPNPAAPQTDASDEFIELYNANDVSFDLSSFSLQAGLTTLHHFTFPTGTTLKPRSFTAFFSADTGLSMSNTSGQVSLLTPDGAAVSTAQPYDAAPDGQAWALANGAWAWTSTPTPNAPNVITTSVTTTSKAISKTVAASATSKKATTKKSQKSTTNTAKTAKAKSTSAKAVNAKVASSVSSVAAPIPVHTSILAFAALFAILYGAYEYRGDLANRLHQFRSYRSARSQARRGVARERGD